MSLTIPAPRLPDPYQWPSFRWGVIGTGIGRSFVRAVAQQTRQRVVAVTARDQAKTHAFAAEFGIETVHSSVEALVNDPGLDVVYIASPHPLHKEQALAAIAAGKHVLVEKPIAMSAVEANEITSAGRAAGVLVMEAMWTRYLPQADVIRRVIADGIIGDVHQVQADFGFVSQYDPSNRLWAPELGGGALLDAGIYPVSFSSSILGSPTLVRVAGDRGRGGVDTRVDILLAAPRGRALLSTSITTQLPTIASVSGSEGGITIGAPFFTPTQLTVTRGAAWDGDRAVFSTPELARNDGGIGLQATALAQYVAEGRLESPLHPHSEVVDVMRVLDVAREVVSRAPLD
ncbi:oxidoreductase [Microbacterium sp. Root166]|uniref:Gfo/Idh/MocA family protein n=1 Tax=Microbacterium sp. Root166 TaxID=1736478 RepID=UPI0006F5F2C5|nr:Gfo/Idh/MocA family oxidoreductase [Microbacterium sp. Root166]KQZ86106.1 oxidoreductase [Microbacterium sp. Root166]